MLSIILKNNAFSKYMNSIVNYTGPCPFQEKEHVSDKSSILCCKNDTNAKRQGDYSRKPCGQKDRNLVGRAERL